MDVRNLKGIGPKKKDLLRKLDIHTVSDLYNYYPSAFEDRRELVNISQANFDKKSYYQWKIASKTYQNRTSRGIITYLYAYEEATNSKIKIIWFNDRFSANKLEYDKTYKFYTKLSINKSTLEAINPMFCELDDYSIGSLVPIYPLTAGINQKLLSSFIAEALKNYDNTEEIFANKILDHFEMKSRYENLSEIHKPTDVDKLKKSKSDIKVMDFTRDLVYIDYINQKLQKTEDLDIAYDLDYILARLAFTLTRSQLISLKEILRDAESDKLMNRLLIGDVGSGKTIIAILIMIVYGLNGYQSAMMVPTEVLATQQYEKNLGLIESFGLRAGLLTGSTKNKVKFKEALANGDIDIVIGTHALIQDDVTFKNLKFVVNDEQHRFGVGQRQMLGMKSSGINYLSMTATPIPRTVSLRLAKILDLSMITERPAGRKPITTKLVHQAMEDTLFYEIGENLDLGRQIYVVSNNIDAEDKNSVENLYKRYKKHFKNKKISKLHGDMKAADKDKTLKDFSLGLIDILISTTVIEVGIDVANANTMVIYNANHFGLSSLHQLRGRVGRGEAESFCYLVTNNLDNRSKLNILVETDDGLEIAKKDFDLRGGGKILSSIQHGRNLSQVEYLTMTPDEIDKSFKLLDYIKASNYEGVDFDYIEKFFKEEKRIILN